MGRAARAARVQPERSVGKPEGPGAPAQGGEAQHGTAASPETPPPEWPLWLDGNPQSNQEVDEARTLEPAPPAENELQPLERCLAKGVGGLLAVRKATRPRATIARTPRMASGCRRVYSAQSSRRAGSWPSRSASSTRTARTSVASGQARRVPPRDSAPQGTWFSGRARHFRCGWPASCGATQSPQCGQRTLPAKAASSSSRGTSLRIALRRCFEMPSSRATSGRPKPLLSCSRIRRRRCAATAFESSRFTTLSWTKRRSVTLSEPTRRRPHPSLRLPSCASDRAPLVLGQPRGGPGRRDQPRAT